MDHLQVPLDELAARVGRFVADEDARLLWIPVDARLADAARKLLLAHEWHPQNRRPFFVLEAATTSTDPGWSARTQDLRDQYLAQVDAFDEQAIGLPALPDPDPGTPALIAFGTTATAMAAVFAGEDLPTAGMLVVLAPTVMANRAVLIAALETLVAAPALAAARWIWLDVLEAKAPDEAVASLVSRLGERAMAAPCLIDDAAQKQETDALLANVLAAVSAGVSPGRAGPGIAPPPHPSDPPRVLGPAPASPTAEYLRPLLEAVQALRAGKTAEALPRLREARDAAVAGGNARDAAEVEILSGAIVAQLAAADGIDAAPGLTLFDGATRRAEEAGAPAVAAKAQLLLGISAQMGEDEPAAAAAFVRAAALAREAEVPALAFEALRLAGELALRRGLRARAGALFAEAIAIAEAQPAEAAERTGLAASAARLAEDCRRERLVVPRAAVAGGGP